MTVVTLLLSIVVRINGQARIRSHGLISLTSGRQWYRGRASASCTKGPGFESRDERGLPLGFFPHKRRDYWLSTCIQEADIERD